MRRRIPDDGGTGGKREAFFIKPAGRLGYRRSDRERHDRDDREERGSPESEMPVREVSDRYRYAAPASAHGDDS